MCTATLESNAERSPKTAPAGSNDQVHPDKPAVALPWQYVPTAIPIEDAPRSMTDIHFVLQPPGSRDQLGAERRIQLLADVGVSTNTRLLLTYQARGALIYESKLDMIRNGGAHPSTHLIVMPDNNLPPRELSVRFITERGLVNLVNHLDNKFLSRHHQGTGHNARSGLTSVMGSLGKEVPTGSSSRKRALQEIAENDEELPGTGPIEPLASRRSTENLPPVKRNRNAKSGSKW
jgi:hypothetical protein